MRTIENRSRYLSRVSNAVLYTASSVLQGLLGVTPGPSLARRAQVLSSAIALPVLIKNA